MRITPAERRVLDLVPTTLSRKEMAAKLFISDRTVKFHLGNLYKKFGASNRRELVCLICEKK